MWHFWESHGTFSGMSFQPNFLARAPALQSVAFSSHMLHCASICKFYRHWRPGILLGKSWDIFRKVLPPQFFGTSTGVAVSHLADPKSGGFLPQFLFDQIFFTNFFLIKILWHDYFHKKKTFWITVLPILPSKTQPTYLIKPTKPNLPNQTF